ncbi:MAG: hypothetical protein QXK63_03825 [Thermoproteus sp.]
MRLRNIWPSGVLVPHGPYTTSTCCGAVVVGAAVEVDVVVLVEVEVAVGMLVEVDVVGGAVGGLYVARTAAIITIITTMTITATVVARDNPRVMDILILSVIYSLIFFIFKKKFVY